MSRASDIYQFTCTHNSFEEWLMWELYLACNKADGLEAQVKPLYSKYGIAEKTAGDLAIWQKYAFGQSKITAFVEIVLLHHDNRNKEWRDKIAHDTAKLKKFAGSNQIVPMQLIVAADYEDITNSPKWKSYLNSLAIWAHGKPFEHKGILPPDGQVLIKGWTNFP